ncbi:hypothetical protein O1C08_001358 [Vibrio cholerae]|nr:hypothetical protein [Vibrio cholerae]
MRALQQLDLLIGAAVLLVAFVAYQQTRAAVVAVDKWAAAATADAGTALSNFFARFNGWEPVQLKPLLIRDFYLTEDMKLTPDAEQTLWKIDEYRPFLVELFGTKGGALKPQYYGLINVEITQRTL